MELNKLTERINELARKSKAEGLTEEEKKEQEVLRKDYIERYKKNLRPQLEELAAAIKTNSDKK